MHAGNPDIWTLAGLGAGTVGALLLGYDIIFGPGQRFKDAVRKNQLKILKDSRESNRDIIKSLKNYSKKEIQDLLDEEDKKFGPDQRELQSQVGEFDGQLSRYENRVVSIGIAGIFLIVAAFVLQAVGLAVHMTEGATLAPVERTPSALKALPNK